MNDVHSLIWLIAIDTFSARVRTTYSNVVTNLQINVTMIFSIDWLKFINSIIFFFMLISSFWQFEFASINRWCYWCYSYSHHRIWHMNISSLIIDYFNFYMKRSKLSANNKFNSFNFNVCHLTVISNNCFLL